VLCDFSHGGGDRRLFDLTISEQVTLEGAVPGNHAERSRLREDRSSPLPGMAGREGGASSSVFELHFVCLSQHRRIGCTLVLCLDDAFEVDEVEELLLGEG